jgi:hypothetical protein
MPDSSATQPLPGIEFLCITMYTEDIGPLRSYYHEVLGLPIDYEVPGHIAAMPKVSAHDPTEGPAGRMRIHFLCDDVPGFAAMASGRGVHGVLSVDGFGKPSWESADPFGNLVTVLTRQ